MVVVYHSNLYLSLSKAASPWSWISAVFSLGWVGVPIFFVISGYCISATAEVGRRKGSGTKLYFKRRIRRIFPPYWAALGLTAVLVAGLDTLVPGLYSGQVNGIPRPWQLGPLSWIWNLTLTESWLGPLVGKEQFFLSPAWTLCYEEQFYAITGLLLVVCRRRFFTGAVVVTILTMLARLLKLTVPGAFFDGRWFMFAAGMAVYYGINYPSRIARRATLAALICGVVYAGLHPRLPGGAPGHYREMLVAFLFALMIAVLHRWDGQIAAARALGPLMLCGTLCYSLYLMHWPVVKAISHGAVLMGVTGGPVTALVVIPVCLACSLAAAWWFHRLVERRFMNAPRT
jgi:peptidoglycan/LPS O-acetylase OafA/YrhL